MSTKNESKSEIITDYSELSDVKLNETAKSGNTATQASPDFVFTGTDNPLTRSVAAQKAFDDELIQVPTGTHAVIERKNQLRDSVLYCLRDLCGDINIQAAGDINKLMTTLFPLKKTKSTVHIGAPINFTAVNKGGGVVELGVDLPTYFTHGSVFAVRHLTSNTPVNEPINWMTWHFNTVNGHKLALRGLTIGETYQFAVSYKGKDGEEYVWSAIVTLVIGS